MLFIAQQPLLLYTTGNVTVNGVNITTDISGSHDIINKANMLGNNDKIITLYDSTTLVAKQMSTSIIGTMDLGGTTIAEEVDNVYPFVTGNPYESSPWDFWDSTTTVDLIAPGVGLTAQDGIDAHLNGLLTNPDMGYLKALTYINTPSDRKLGNHPETGDPIFVKQGTFGPYVSLGQFPKWPKASTREGLLLKLPHHLKVLKVAAAYLRTIVRSSDDAAVLRIVNSPPRGVGKASLEKSVDFAKEKEMSLLEAFGYATDFGVKGTALTGINELLDLHKIFVDQISDKPDDVLRTVLEKSGYWAELEASKNSENQIEVIEAFLVVAAHYETVAELVKELDHQEDLKKQPKPKTASLFDTMTFEHVNLEDALQLLSLPRVVGEDSGIEVTVQNGPYGPYVKKGGETRSLRNEEELFTISLEDCLTLLSQPKKFGRAAKPPLADFGLDPVSNSSILLREGRFGTYVTDGVHNASLQLGDEINELSFDRAAELLAEARLKGPKKKPKSKRK